MTDRLERWAGSAREEVIPRAKVPYAMGQFRLTDPKRTLRIYAQEIPRRDGERERLRALLSGDCLAAATPTPELQRLRALVENV